MHGTLPATPQRRPASGSRLPLLLRLAFRELRGGLQGFGIFLACIALGVAAIASVSSLSRSLTEGITREGRRILGGDMAFSLLQREAAAGRRTLRVRTPLACRIRLLRNGSEIAAAAGTLLDLEVEERGVYRVEAVRNSHGRERTWIVSNPIYLR